MLTGIITLDSGEEFRIDANNTDEILDKCDQIGYWDDTKIRQIQEEHIEYDGGELVEYSVRDITELWLASLFQKKRYKTISEIDIEQMWGIDSPARLETSDYYCKGQIISFIKPIDHQYVCVWCDGDGILAEHEAGILVSLTDFFTGVADTIDYGYCILEENPGYKIQIGLVCDNELVSKKDFLSICKETTEEELNEYIKMAERDFIAYLVDREEQNYNTPNDDYDD